MKNNYTSRDNVRRLLYDNGIKLSDESTGNNLFKYSSGSVINHNDNYWDIKGAKIFHNMDLQNKFFKKLPNKIELGFLEFKRMGFILVSIPLVRKDKWFRDQIVAYIILHKNSDIDPSYNILTSIPENTKILYDPKEKKIRLWGRNTGNEGYGPWIDMR